MVNMYELSFIARATLSEDDLANLIEQTKKIIVDLEGEIAHGFANKKVYLAYPIKKQSQAMLCGFDFNLDKEKINVLESQIKKNENILRHLLFAKKIPKEKPITAKRPKVKIKTKPKAKVKIEELDKKLEEILQE